MMQEILGSGREDALQLLARSPGYFPHPHLAYLIWSDLVYMAASGRQKESAKSDRKSCVNYTQRFSSAVYGGLREDVTVVQTEIMYRCLWFTEAAEMCCRHSCSPQAEMWSCDHLHCILNTNSAESASLYLCVWCGLGMCLNRAVPQAIVSWGGSSCGVLVPF